MSRAPQNAISIHIPEEEINAVVTLYADEIVEEAAKEVLHRAQRSDAFDDDSGGLRESGEQKPSKFNKNERLVQFTKPHAHLIENGHILTKGREYAGRLVGYVPPHPFLGPARDSVMNDMTIIIARVVPPNIEVK